jgi:competence protein ComEA
MRRTISRNFIIETTRLMPKAICCPTIPTTAQICVPGEGPTGGVPAIRLCHIAIVIRCDLSRRLFGCATLWCSLAILLALASCQENPARSHGSPRGAGGPSLLVDLNSASVSELEALPGVGPVYARAILAGRPYANKTQLRARQIIPPRLYEQMVDRVVARQPRIPTR